MTRTLTVTSRAKVNLSLNVLEKRPEDGYHYVDMMMVPISLADSVRLTIAGEITVACEPDVAGPMERNLAYRAAALLQQVTGVTQGAAIHIHKMIPVAGGLAGGSTNAAAVLTGLNQLWGTALSEEQLIQLAIRLGSDVPFFIPQRPARVQGIGERLLPVAQPRPLWLVLSTPAVEKSTGNVYRLYDELEHVDRPDVAAMEAAMSAGDVSAVAANLGNVFEQVMLPLHPAIAALKATMVREGALGALMSGAGPTVFGLVADEAEGLRLCARLAALGVSATLAHTTGSGERS